MDLTEKQSEALAAIASSRPGETPKIHGMSVKALLRLSLIEGGPSGWTLTSKGRSIVDAASRMEMNGRPRPVDPLKTVRQIPRPEVRGRPSKPKRPPSHFEDLRAQIEARYQADLDALDRVIEIQQTIQRDAEA